MILERKREKARKDRKDGKDSRDERQERAIRDPSELRGCGHHRLATAVAAISAVAQLTIKFALPLRLLTE